MPRRHNDAILLQEQAAPSTPASGLLAIYAKTDGSFYYKDDAGTEVSLPRGALGYASKTATQGPSTTSVTVDATGLTTTVTVGSGRRIKISYKLLMNSSVADDIAIIELKEGAAVLQQDGFVLRPATWNLTCVSFKILTPSSGAHTYKLAFGRWGGSGGVNIYADATNVAQLLVEDIGV